MREKSDEELTQMTSVFKNMLRRGKSEENILPEAFALQKMPFYIAKGHLLLCKRASFIFRTGIYLTIIPYLPYFHWISIGIGYTLSCIAKKPLRHSPILYNKV